MTPSVFTPGGFRPVIQPRRRVLPFRRRGMGDTPQTFQQALAATGWKPGQPIPFIPTPPGGWPDINPATGAVIPANPAPTIVTAASGGPAGDQMGQSITPTPATPAPSAAAPVAAVQPAGAPSPVSTSAPQTGSFLSIPFLGFPVWMWGAAAVVGFLIFNQDKGHYGR